MHSETYLTVAPPHVAEEPGDRRGKSASAPNQGKKRKRQGPTAVGNDGSDISIFSGSAQVAAPGPSAACEPVVRTGDPQVHGDVIPCIHLLLLCPFLASVCCYVLLLHLPAAAYLPCIHLLLLLSLSPFIRPLLILSFPEE